MADEKISQLALKATLDAADQWVIVDSVSAETKKVTGFDQKVGTADTVEFLDASLTNQNFTNGLIHTNASGDLLSGPAQITTTTDKFTITNGNASIAVDAHFLNVTGNGGSAMVLEGDFTLNADLTVSAETFLNQPLRTSDSPSFSGMFLSGATDTLILNKMTTAQRTGFAGVNGMVVYDTTLEQFQKYENGAWADTEGNNTFAGLTDVTSPYTTVNALYRVNSATTGVEETTATVVTDTDEVTLANGSASISMSEHALTVNGAGGSSSMTLTGDLDLIGSLTVNANSALNQNLQTTNTPTFAGATLTSTTQALVVPRMTTAQKGGLAALNGMIIYDTTLNKFQGYENGAWANFA